MLLAGRKVAVIGLGSSGVAAARLCLARGAQVRGFDAKPLDKLSAEARALTDAGMQLLSGQLSNDWVRQADLVVLSPGFPEGELREVIGDAPLDLISELDLASRFVTGPMALIGGTNGKSTVTAWVGDMLEKAGKKVFVGGNFGTPLSEAVGEEWDALIVEISSFQAEHVPSCHARVHALLNISEDHLDRYDDFAAYADAKGNPFENMGRDDLAVLRLGDEASERQARRGGASRVFFSVEEGCGDVSPSGDDIVDRVRQQRYPRASLKLGGLHNLANACASIAVASHLGAPSAAIAESLGSFRGLPHRYVLVAESAGVRFYDDSKATNVGATVAALGGTSEQRVVLIAGGRDKWGPLEPLVEALRSRGRGLVLIGEAADRFAKAATGVLPIEHASTMSEAVRAAEDLAQAGDAVLLSPACSSFDMYASYRHRGEAFIEAVNALGGQS